SLGTMVAEGFVPAPGAEPVLERMKAEREERANRVPRIGPEMAQEGPSASEGCPTRGSVGDDSASPMNTPFPVETFPEPTSIHAVIGRVNGGAGRSPFDPPSRSSRWDNNG